MVYVIGVFGFLTGLVFGQMVLFYMLRHKSREDLINQKNLRWTYGVLNWALAFAGLFIFIHIYKRYFG